MVNPVKVIKGLLGAEEDLADFIQNGPSTGLPGYVRDRFRDRCNEFANLPPWARALSGVAGGSIDRFCSPYWDDNGWDGPESAPAPYSGGQCPGATYRGQATSEATNQPPQPSTTGFDFMLGPIDYQGQFQAGSLIGFRVVAADGQVYLFNQQGSTFRDPNEGWTLTDVSFIRTGGDDCDNPDPPPTIEPGPNPPPNPGPLPGPEPTDNPDPENPIPFFPIPPFEDPTFGPLPITGPSETPPVEPSPPAGGDGLPGDGGAIGGAAGEVNGDEPGQEIEFGPPPEGRIWVGCIVDLIVDSRIGNIPGTGPQSPVWPSVRGNVALKYSTLFGTSQRINSRYTELFRPNTALTVTGCFLQVQPGGSGLVFPISALTCPENPCEESNG